MNHRARGSEGPPPRFAVWRLAATLVAAVVFLGAWTLIHHGWWRGLRISDTPVYARYGDAMVRGEVPYRDFDLEYPPGSLPAFLAPELTARSGDQAAYDRAFDRWMAGCGVATTLLLGLALAVLRTSAVRTGVALAVVAASPVLLGTVVQSRFDLWPAALTAGTAAALLSGRDRLGAGLLGAAIAVKLYAVVLVPLALVWVWRRGGGRLAAIWTAVLGAVLAAIFLPFAVLAPGGLAHSFWVQFGRPLQIESLGASALLAAHQLVGLSVGIETTHGSQNLGGASAAIAGTAVTLLQVGALAWVWIAFARGESTRERLAVALAAAVVAFVAFNRVFSPQYLVWLLPFVPLARSRAATALLTAALLLTQAWFPKHYPALVHHLSARESWEVVARDLLVVALFAVLARSLAPRLGRNAIA